MVKLARIDTEVQSDERSLSGHWNVLREKRMRRTIFRHILKANLLVFGQTQEYKKIAKGMSKNRIREHCLNKIN